MARKINVTDKIAVQIQRLTPKNGVSIFDAINSNERITAPVKKIKDKYFIK